MIAFIYLWLSRRRARDGEPPGPWEPVDHRPVMRPELPDMAAAVERANAEDTDREHAVFMASAEDLWYVRSDGVVGARLGGMDAVRGRRRE